MKLNFGILWIEDNPTSDQENEIRSSVKQSGFEARIINIPSGKDIQEHAENQRKYHLFDLILIDFKLSEKPSGDKLAAEVRKSFSYTPILFYSGNESDTKLRKRIADLKVEGVYCSHRSNFIKRTCDLISDYAQSLGHLSGMRGLAAQIVAEIDESFRIMIPRIITIDGKSKAVEYIINKLNKQSTDLQKKAKKLDNLNDCLNSIYVDSSKLYGMFIHFIKEHIKLLDDQKIIDDLRNLIFEIKNYEKEVLGIRNTLAHSREIKDENGYVIINKSGTQKIIPSDFPNIRNDFISYLECIKKIQNILVDQQK